MFVFSDGKLIDREPFIIVGVIEIDHLGLSAANGAIRTTVFYRYTIHQPAVYGAVTGIGSRPIWPHNLPEGIIEGFRGKFRV